jgi:Zn-dependent protease
MATPALLQDQVPGPSPSPPAARRPPKPDNYALHAALFLITWLSTTIVGMRYADNFNHGLFPLSSDADIFPYDWVIHHWRLLPLGLPFSCTLIGILLVHEFGHYFACRYYGIRATLPYMLPAPSLSGTAGAVIRLKSRIKSRAALLAIGAFGPISGFAVAIVSATLGLLHSRPVATEPAHLVSFSKPLLIRLLMRAIEHTNGLNLHGPLLWHPVFVASWIGILITSLNLIPAGQLDGGHILYSLSPKTHKVVTYAMLSVLVYLGIRHWLGWLIWAGLLMLPGMRHPQVPNDNELPRSLWILPPLCLLLFILCATPEPFHNSSLVTFIAKIHAHKQ